MIVFTGVAAIPVPCAAEEASGDVEYFNINDRCDFQTWITLMTSQPSKACAPGKRSCLISGLCLLSPKSTLFRRDHPCLALSTIWARSRKRDTTKRGRESTSTMRSHNINIAFSHCIVVHDLASCFRVFLFSPKRLTGWNCDGLNEHRRKIQCCHN
jgi:hypothetical protein